MRVAFALAALIFATPAQARVVDLLKWKEDCKGGVVTADRLVQRLLSTYNVPWDPILLRARLDGKLGDQAFSSPSDELKKLAQETVSFAAGSEPSGNGFTVRVRPLGPGETPVDRVAQLLDGSAPWLEIACSPTEPPAPILKGLGETITIAASADEADKELKARKAASLSYERDRQADTDVVAISLYASFDTSLGQQPLAPFIDYQKNSGKTRLNDLTLGFKVPHFLANNDKITLSPSYETDDFFRSSVWRAELGWEPHWDQWCANQNLVPESHGWSCTLRLVGDYADIVDPGKKAGLKTLHDYGRLGANLDIAYYRRVGTSLDLTTAAGYAVRQDLGGHAGDAERWTASIGVSPIDIPNISISLEWTKGADLTSLTKERTLALKLGYKQ